MPDTTAMPPPAASPGASGPLDDRASGWRGLVGDATLAGWWALHRLRRGGRVHPPAAAPVAAPASHPLRVLVVVPLSIEPPIHGGAVRITNLVRRLATRHDVSLLLLLGGTDAPDHRQALVPPCTEVLVHPVPRGPDRDRWRLWPALARPFASRALADRVAALVHGHGFDLVQLEFSQLGGLVTAAAPAATVLVEHDLSFRSHARQLATGVGRYASGRALLGSGWLDRIRLLRYELAACRQADQVHVMSAADRTVLADELGRDDHLRVIANGVDTGRFTTPADPAAPRAGVLLLGSFPHLPNRDAFDWTMSEIWPLIRRRHPTATLTVAGARPTAEVLAWDGRDGIRVAGEVVDVRPLLQRHRALLVPLRSGSGTRLKILEAMACGLPVVTTTIGAEGLPCTAEIELLVADEPASLAAAVGRLLLDDGSLATRLGAAGRRLVAEHFDWDGIAAAADTGWRAAAGDCQRRHASAPSGVAATTAVVIPVLEDGSRLPEVLASIATQADVTAVDRILVDARARPGRPLAADGWRTVAAPAPGRLGPALDAGMRATAAPVVAFLAADAVPADAAWLAHLTAPLRAERPPAAVQGAVWEQPVAGGIRIDPAATAETRRWIGAYGLRFDVACAAVRRDAWLQAPFGPWPRLAELHWQRIAHECGWLILPCWDAAVVRVRRRPLGWWWHELRREATEWRSLGASYHLLDAVGDLVLPRLTPHRQGWLAVLGSGLRSHPHAHLSWLRPLALLATRRP